MGNPDQPQAAPKNFSEIYYSLHRLSCNSSDLGVFLSSMPVNWIGRVGIRDLSRQSRREFQLHDLVDLIPRQGLRPCNPFLAFPDQTSSPVVDTHWRDITPTRSRYP